MMGSAGNQMQWQCHDGASNPHATGFPTGFQSCNAENVRGLAASMRFPSCWNGKDFDIKAPLAHMAFPTNADGMAGCPAPFNQARFPEIFVEYYFDVSSFDHITKDYTDLNNPPWVLADGKRSFGLIASPCLLYVKPQNMSWGYRIFRPSKQLGGDADSQISQAIQPATPSTWTSYVFPHFRPIYVIHCMTNHTPQLNGWTPGVLQKAMESCTIADGGSNVAQKTGLASDACFGVKTATSEGYRLQDTMNQCTLASIVSPAEDIGLTGTALDALPGCNPIQGGPQPANIHPPSTCGAPSEVAGGSAPAPVATSAFYNTATSATSAAIVASSSSVAAGPSTPTSVSSVPPMSPSETPSTSTSTSSTTPTGVESGSPSSSITVNGTSGSEIWTYQGCYTDLSPDRNTRSLAKWGSGQSSTDCANHCFAAGYIISGTEYGAQCFCGNMMTSTTKMADNECNQACVANPSEMCGGPSRLSVYAKAGTMMTKRASHLHRHAVRHAESF